MSKTESERLSKLDRYCYLGLVVADAMNDPSPSKTIVGSADRKVRG